MIAAWADPPALSLSLDEALAIARSNHPLLASGRGAVEAEQGLETEARAPLLPQLSMANTYQRANSRVSSFGAGSAFTNYASTFGVSQLVTDFGKTSQRVRAAHEGVVSAQETLQATLQGVLFNVYQAYDQVLQSQAAVDVQKESVRNLENHLKQAEAFFSAGTQPKIDVTQAEVNLSNGKLSLVQAQNSFEIAKTNLKAAMGKPDFPPFTVADPLKEPAYAVSLLDAVKIAYGNRPDLLSLQAQEKAAHATLAAAQQGYYPDLSGTTNYGWVGPTWPPRPNTWSFGATLNIPIFNGLLTQGQIEQARGQLAEAVAQAENLRITIRQGVEGAYDNLTAAKMSVKVAQDSLRYAKENFELAQGRYKVGVGSYLEYTDAEVSLTQAETNLIQALGNYNIAIAALKQAMGIL